MMNHRQRVLHTLTDQPIDRVARGEFFIADEFVRAFLSRPAAAAIDHADRAVVIEQLDLDIAAVSFSDGWGALQQPDQDRALESVMRWHAESDRFVFAVIDGPFSAAVKAAGFDALMRYTHSVPNVATEYFQRGADEVRVIAQAVRDAGADGVVLGEDLAFNRATFFSPVELRELYIPALTRLVRQIHDFGLTAFFHSDGNLNAILNDLAACGVDGVQGLEPQANMSMRGVREKVGDALTLWGNLSFDFLGATRTDAEIDQAVQSIIDRNGKVILGSCSGLVEGMNCETVRRVYRWTSASG